jgi:SPOR domain
MPDRVRVRRGSDARFRVPTGSPRPNQMNWSGRARTFQVMARRAGTRLNRSMSDSRGRQRFHMTTRGRTTDVSAKSLQSVDDDDLRMSPEQGLAPTAAKGRWRLTPKGRALVGLVAVVSLVLALRCVLGFGLFVDNGPAHGQFLGDKTMAESSDVGAPPGKGNAHSAQGKFDPRIETAKAGEVSAPTAAQAVVQSADAQAVSPESAKQPVNPPLRTIGDVLGARASSAQQSIDPTPTGSTGWAVQLAASKSEDIAKDDLKRLNDRYGSALNGSTIRLHKARVDGETVYQLRVVGLSKADATALCDRLKGDGDSCFIVR